jgi:hypothetical protein
MAVSQGSSVICYVLLLIQILPVHADSFASKRIETLEQKEAKASREGAKAESAKEKADLLAKDFESADDQSEAHEAEKLAAQEERTANEDFQHAREARAEASGIFPSWDYTTPQSAIEDHQTVQNDLIMPCAGIMAMGVIMLIVWFLRKGNQQPHVVHDNNLKQNLLHKEQPRQPEEAPGDHVMERSMSHSTMEPPSEAPDSPETEKSTEGAGEKAPQQESPAETLWGKLFGSAHKSTAVTFSVKVDTKFGEEVHIIGSAEALGKWDPSNAPQMVWSDGEWVTTLDLELPPAGSEHPVEYKYFLKCTGKKVHWETCGNRHLCQEKGSVSHRSSMVCNSIWNSA